MYFIFKSFEYKHVQSDQADTVQAVFLLRADISSSKNSAGASKMFPRCKFS